MELKERSQVVCENEWGAARKGRGFIKKHHPTCSVKKTISSARAGLELQSRLLFDSQIIEPCTLSYQEVSLAVNHHGVYSGLRCIVKLYR